ncbi:putative NADPH--hemoprotein reductase [Helianthus annuus]|nr:putative NADPH--hemoprotein reductase [Helianthus annuus]
MKYNQTTYFSFPRLDRMAQERIHVICALVYEKIPTGHTHKEKCSTWMKHEFVK